ncbi:MAG TPA: serine/threonine-protein kinase [Gaiellaceae bacterium]|nr:serine/threonine-protein kinase [Gaiellaceae bacterium]
MSAYTVEAEIGRGGMAVVYAGRQPELDRPVALKVLAAHLAGNAEFRDRFLREARIAARLHHPHLVRTFDVTELDRLPCIVMELLPGGTLEGGRLTREEAAQVADALAYAHRHGVVHRDLKPGNLLRGNAGEVKIADFGIARAAEETMLTEAGTVLGTLRYLSPEQAAGRPVGPEADVYSLGVVLRELLVEPAPALVEACLAEDPRERPTASAVAAELADDDRTRVLRPARRKALPWALGAGALAAAAAAVAVAVTQQDAKPAPVEPVRHATTPAQQARNLEAWLKRYSAR